ncbi:MAG: bifunctional DNA primase/polymerase [Planctomycetaceae bacterium]|jgi:hypothetical protein|nr:bifunctional DNA primase/polymerase [Planctomycetaceae bacterium]
MLTFSISNFDEEYNEEYDFDSTLDLDSDSIPDFIDAVDFSGNDSEEYDSDSIPDFVDDVDFDDDGNVYHPKRFFYVNKKYRKIRDEILRERNNCGSNSDCRSDNNISDNSPCDNNIPITKICPQCKEIVRTHVKTCPDCGFEFENVPPPPEKTIKKPRTITKKAKNRKTLTAKQIEEQKQKREKERQEGLERVAKLKAEKDENKKEKRKQREKERQFRINAEKEQKEAQRLLKKAEKGISKSQQLLNRFQQHRRQYLSDVFDYNIVLNELSDPNADPFSLAPDEQYHIYKRRDGRKVRYYIANNHYVYSQLQNKRNPDKWNKPMMLNFGICQKEVYRLAKRGFEVFPLRYGTNKPLGSRSSFVDQWGYNRYKNGSRIYGVKDASYFRKDINYMFHFRECDGMSGYNIAIACGNVTVLDFDNFESETTQEYIDWFCEKFGMIEKALVAFTPGSDNHTSGVHLFIEKYDNIKSSTLIPGVLDIKNDPHSYVCAAGSVKDKGSYRWLDSNWIKEHGNSKYQKILEQLPVKDVILFDNFKSIRELGSLNDVQKKGLDYIVESKFTGMADEDIKDKDCKEAEQPVVKSGFPEFRNYFNAKANKESSEVIITIKKENKTISEKDEIVSDTQLDDKQSVEKRPVKKPKNCGIPKDPPFTRELNIQPEQLEPVNDSADNVELILPEPTTPIEEAAIELLKISHAANHDESRLVWIDPKTNRTSIHVGWRKFFMTSEDAEQSDADKDYLLWKTTIDKIKVGYRNQSLTSFAGLLCRENEKLPPLEVVLKALQLYNSQLKNPLPYKEVQKIGESIHHRSLEKRGNNPNKVFKSNKNNPTTPALTLREKLKKWHVDYFYNKEKEFLYVATIAQISFGKWNFKAGEDEYFDLTEFKKLVGGDSELSHADGQTIIRALKITQRELCPYSFNDYKKCRKWVRHADGTLHQHTVIYGITYTYDPQKTTQKINNVRKQNLCADSGTPLGVCRWFIIYSGFLGNCPNLYLDNCSNKEHNISITENNKEKNSKRSVICINKRHLYERTFNSFVLFLDYRFFRWEHRFKRGLKWFINNIGLQSENSELSSHTVT